MNSRFILPLPDCVEFQNLQRRVAPTIQGFNLHSKCINRLKHMSCRSKWVESRINSSLWFENPSWFEWAPYHTWGMLKTREPGFPLTCFCSRVKISHSFNSQSVPSTLLRDIELGQNGGIQNRQLVVLIGEFLLIRTNIVPHLRMVLKERAWFSVFRLFSASSDTATAYFGERSTHTPSRIRIESIVHSKTTPVTQIVYVSDSRAHVEGIWFQWIFCCAKHQHTSWTGLYLPPRTIASWASILSATPII